MMNSSVVNTNSDISVNITGIQRQANRDRDAANMYIHEDRDHIGIGGDGRDVSPDLHSSFACRSVRSASIDSIASIAQQAAQLPSCSSAIGSVEEPPTKKRRKQSNPVRYGQTALPANVLPIGLDEEVGPEEDNDDDEDDDDDESLVAAGLRVASQLQRSGSFSSSDDDSNDDDIEDDLERRKLLQQSVANVMNFHKFQHLCPHCNCPFGNDDDLRSHIEEEHVQKLLERQLFQHHQHHQQQLNNKSLLNGPNQMRPTLSDLCKYDQNQHKFNSSDSPSGSSSSGSNNNSPLQSPSGLPERKSFDATQPLRHGSSDSNVKDFGSNFLPFQMPPNMPPLIPMSQSGGTSGAGAGDGSKASGQSSSPGAAPISLAMFPNPMTPFLFPMLPTGVNSGGNSNSGSMSAMVSNVNVNANGGQQVSSGGVRIFNPEAYCELCNKEFCNKYFLKTHKANKHGIYSMDTLVGPQGYGSPFFPTGLDTSSGSPTAAAAAALQMQHLLQSSAGLTPTSTALVVTTPVRSNVINMESYCEICQKEFCNKYFLKKHKQKIHGITDPNNPHHSHQSSSASPGSCSNEPQIKGSIGHSPSPPLVNTSLALPVSSNTCMALVRVSTPVSTTSPLTSAERPDRPPQMPTPVMVSSQTSSPSNSFVCEICKHEFPNIISLQTHRFTTHYPQSMHAMIPNVSSAHLQSMASSAADDSPAPRPIVGPISSLSDTGSFVFTPEKLREMGVINADAFCEICCKEFCNKYFLRTHKINKHGMSFDSNSSSKSQSGRNSGDNKGDDSNNMSDDSFLEPGQRDPSSYGPNGSDFFNAMSGMHSELQCDHCSRPFASHYLLKMHRFYSHNIPYIKEEDIRKSMASSPGASSEVPNDNIAKGIADSPDATGALVVRQQNVDTSGNGQTSECESNGGTGGTGVNADQASQDLQKLQTMIKELNSSSYLDKALCHLCRQEFENKYFLRVHMMNDHGVIAPDDSAPMDSNTFMRNFFDANRQAFPFVQSSLQSGDSEAFCDICHKEFCSKYFLKTHKQNIHGIFEGPPTPTDTTPPPFPPQTSPHPFTSHRKSSDEAVNLAMSPNRNKSQMPAQPMQLVSNKQLSQMPSMSQMSQMTQMTPQSLVSQTAQLMSADGKTRNVTGRNYCNICNKELCNKYFMKTHMLKMHGINIDEHPVEASANSTIGGVTCDICQKELCSKYFLKVHKQNTHGIYEEPPQPKEPRRDGMESSASNNSMALSGTDREPQAAHGIDPNDTNNRYFSHYTEVCPLCERRFKSIKWLKTHMINDHSDIVALRPTDLSLTGPNADLSRMCILCGQTFSDRVALHIHLVKDHRTTAEELGISGNISGMKLTTNTATDLSIKSEQIAIGAQLAQHLSQHQTLAHQSRMNGSTSPSPVPTSMAMVSIHNSHNSQRSLNANNNIMNNKFISIGPNSSSANTMSNSTIILTSTPTTAISNPLNSTNTTTDTNNAININTNNINNSNNCNKINANNTNGTNTNSNINSGSNMNQLNTSVITCPTISSCLTSSTVTLGINTSTSPTTSTAVVKEDRAPSTLLSSSLSSIISKRTGCGTRIYHCSYCNYSTRWLSNLYAHEKRHTRLNTEADKKFVCRVCHRAYRYNHSLQRHLLNHRSSGLNGRDMNAIALLASGGLHSTSSDKLVGLDSKFSRLFPSGSSHTALHRSLVRPNRVKRYRCSKCNRKFRTRDMCLAHIHVYHSDSRKIILSTASGKMTANKVCRCSYCGFATRNYTLLKIHINKNHNKPTTSPATDLTQLANKELLESPLNLRKSTETATNEVLSLVRHNPESAASPSGGSSDGDSVGGPQFQASGQLTGVGSEESPQLPMTYAMPQSPPNAGSFIMQPFLITQPDADGSLTNDTFVPSLVYLPVSHKVLQPVRVAFQLTPA